MPEELEVRSIHFALSTIHNRLLCLTNIFLFKCILSITIRFTPPQGHITYMY